MKIALVDDHTVIRKGLALLINSMSGMEVILEASHGKEFIEKLDENQLPDVVLIDITMPEMDGVETTRWIKLSGYSMKVLALSMLKNEMLIIRMLKNGARGYLLKDCETNELRKAINNVHFSGYHFNEYLTPELKRDRNLQKKGPNAMFSERELEFIRLACSDLTYKEIGDRMFVSVRTVEGYRDALFLKLDIKTRIGLVLYALKEELVLLGHLEI